MVTPALQMSANDPAFWVLVFVAAMFALIAAALIVLAVAVGRAVRTVRALERRAEPLLERVGALSEQVRQLAAQGQEVAAQVTLLSGHLATASLHFSETTLLIKDEVRELKQLVGYTAATARHNIGRVSRTINQSQKQFSATTYFIQTKLVEPARELGAILAGVRRGLEVLAAPAPKQIDQTYGEEELFIG